MGLRKKLSRKDVKPAKTSSTAHQSPALVSLPSVRPSSPFSVPPVPTLSLHVNRSSTMSSPQRRQLRQTHRRSRSFSALTPQTPPTPHLPLATSMEQPWRNREAWLAIHSPQSLEALTIPSAVPRGAASGWRGRGVCGFFAGGIEGVAPSSRCREVGTGMTKPSTRLDEQRQVKGDKSFGPATLLYRLKTQRAIPRSATFTPLLAPLSPVRGTTLGKPAKLIPSPSLPTFSTYTPPSPPSRSEDRYVVPSEADDDVHLTPLLPHNTLQKSTSFTSFRSISTPIPWGRRTPSERRSASPTRDDRHPHTPTHTLHVTLSCSPPQTPRPAPQRALPPPPADVPCSPEGENGYSPPQSRALKELEARRGDALMRNPMRSFRNGKELKKIERADSPSPTRERLTTPDTPEMTASGHTSRKGGDGVFSNTGKRSEGSLRSHGSYKGRSARGIASIRSTTSRQGSWDEERGSQRGGWI